MTRPPHPRKWGFRFAVVDGIVLAFAPVAAVLLWDLDPLLALLPAFLLAHFFLFCNVFRIRRALELVWAGLFLVNTFAWWLTHDPIPWLGVVGVQIPATVAVIALEMRSPRYHGIFAPWINPGFSEAESSPQLK
jgi:hypothetical protein